MQDYVPAARGRYSTKQAASTPLNGSQDNSANAKLLRQMDATIRCIVSLGRPSGCGMPGSVAAAPLAQLLHAASVHMQQCLQLQQCVTGLPQQDQSGEEWDFVDIGAGAGRMLLAAKLFGASCCAGLELCDLKHTFDACKARLIKKGLLAGAAERSCELHVGDAMHYSSVTALLGNSAAAARPVMVSLIDEGMPFSVREHIYSRVAQDPRVQVVITVNYRSRAGHLPGLLCKAGFAVAQEMPAPLMGGRCSTAGRIYIRQQYCLQPQEHHQQQQQQHRTRQRHNA